MKLLETVASRAPNANDSSRSPSLFCRSYECVKLQKLIAQWSASDSPPETLFTSMVIYKNHGLSTLQLNCRVEWFFYVHVNLYSILKLLRPRLSLSSYHFTKMHKCSVWVSQKHWRYLITTPYNVIVTQFSRAAVKLAFDTAVCFRTLKAP